MAWTSVGFDGTITEIQWAGMASLLGNGYVAAGNGDCLVTAVGGARQVSVAAGSLYGDGVLSTNSGAETVALTTPTNGQWYVIALRRTWATNTAALVAVAGATTTTTTPTAPPTSFPVLNTNVGVLTDQPIAWAWCNSANTTVVVYDIRLKAVKSLPPVVATSAERDAKFMSPTQGLQVWRNDLGAVETYYTAYNSSTNPGGRDTAGWYVTNRSGGLIPITPTTVTVASGTGSITALGKVSFNNATAVSLDKVFTSEYLKYRVVINMTAGTANNASVLLRLRANGVDSASTLYAAIGRYIILSGSTGTRIRAASSDWFIYENGNIVDATGAVEMDITGPQAYGRTFMNGGYTSINGLTMISEIYGAQYESGAQFDGLTIFQTAGNMTGGIQVFGYND